MNSVNLSVSIIATFSRFVKNSSKFYPHHPPSVVEGCADLILQVSEQSTAWFPVTRLNRADIDPLLMFLEIFSSLIHPVKLEKPFSTVPEIRFHLIDYLPLFYLRLFINTITYKPWKAIT